MKKLFCFLLLVYMFSSCQSQTSTNNEPKNKGAVNDGMRITILEVDKSTLSISDRVIVEKIESICNKIDLDKTLRLYQSDTSVVKDNVKYNANYKVYYQKDNDINKIVFQTASIGQKLKYAFYYLDGKISKIESENLEANPFRSTVYISEEKAFLPKEYPQETVDYVKAQAGVIYSYYITKL